MHYFIAIDNKNQIDTVVLEKKLNLALDWIQIMPNVFIVKSGKTKELWYARIKLVANNNLFFITEISLNNNFSGWLHSQTWEWIDKNRINNSPKVTSAKGEDRTLEEVMKETETELDSK